MSETTTVRIELDRQPTIEDIQQALDVFRAEGIPDTFEVDLHHGTERVGPRDLPYSEQEVRHTFWITAERAAKSAARKEQQEGSTDERRRKEAARGHLPQGGRAGRGRDGRG